MTTKNNTYFERNNNQINIAEEKVEEYFNSKDFFYTRLGFDEKAENIPSNMFKHIPKFIRNMPDGLLIDSNKKAWLVEIKGCKDTLHLKHSDCKEYKLWMQKSEIPLILYLYSSTYREIKAFSITDLTEKAQKFPQGRYYDSKKTYWEIPWGNLSNYLKGS